MVQSMASVDAFYGSQCAHLTKIPVWWLIFFLEYTKQVRGDCGTAKDYVACIQSFFRSHQRDMLSGPLSFAYRKSVSNQEFKHGGQS